MKLDLTYCKECGCVYSTNVLRPLKEIEQGTFMRYIYACKMCHKEWSDYE